MCSRLGCMAGSDTSASGWCLMDTQPYAVRWIIGKRALNIAVYTKWHYTIDASFTICNRSILLMDEFNYKLPDTSDDLSVVDCKFCRRKVSSMATG